MNPISPIHASSLASTSYPDTSTPDKWNAVWNSVWNATWADNVHAGINPTAASVDATGVANTYMQELAYDEAHDLAPPIQPGAPQ